MRKSKDLKQVCESKRSRRALKHFVSTYKIIWRKHNAAKARAWGQVEARGAFSPHTMSSVIATGQ
ncbi:hypothetical protein ACFPLB_15915 [Aquamicrobium segne]|uniref:Transposase n=1 Tax=Aquamicrobium segne TaxID=469547 RepID=A0ABW0H216_9HYPH